MKHYGNWNVSGEVTSNSAETKTLTIGETIYVSTRTEWQSLFEEFEGYYYLNKEYDGKNITIFLASTPTDDSFFDTNKRILLYSMDSTGKGTGFANLVGSGSTDYQFLNCTIEGDVSNCNLAFNADATIGIKNPSYDNLIDIPLPIFQGKIKDCQIYFCPTYNTETTGRQLRIGRNTYDDSNAILYKCNYGYNIQIKIDSGLSSEAQGTEVEREGCTILCKYISTSTNLTNIYISTDPYSFYNDDREQEKPDGNYTHSNIYCFHSVNSINNLRLQDNITNVYSWKLGQIWNLSNSYISSNVAFNDKLKYVSSTDFASMSLISASEENKIDFDSCICGGYPSWYWSHKTLQTSINAINKNREDEYYSKYFTSPFSFSVFRYRDIRMISIPNQNVSSLASTTGKIDLGANFGIADSKTYYFSGFLGGYKISISIENVSMYTTLNYSISSNTYTADTINSGLSIIIPCSIS